jgi:hypothetical protein
MTTKKPNTVNADPLWQWACAFLRKVPGASLEKPVEVLTLVVAAVSVAILVWQLAALNRTLESQAYNYILVGLTELDKMFIEKSDLRPHFLENLPLPDDKPTRLKIRALADAKLDFIDAFYSQEGHINWKRYTKQGWEKYFEQSFKCSFVLREMYCRDQNLYGNSLRSFISTIFPSGMCNGAQPKAFSPPPLYCPEE